MPHGESLDTPGAITQATLENQDDGPPSIDSPPQSEQVVTEDGRDQINRTLPDGIISQSSGASSSDVIAIQNTLNLLGYNVSVDGIYGPETAGAIRDFQRDAGITRDGIYGPQTRAAMLGGDASTSGGGTTSGGYSGGSGGGGGGGGGTIPTGDNRSDVSWVNVPNDGEVWNIDGTQALVYNADTDVPIYYTVPDRETMDDIFPGGWPEPERELSQEEADGLGAISPGSVNLLSANVDNWEEGFEAQIQANTKLKPWLEDPEVAATYLAATLEGRTPTESELEETEWFAERSDAQVQYVAFEAKATPEELEQYHNSFREATRNALIESGVQAPSDKLIRFMARKNATGQWSDNELGRQVVAVANPFSSVEMDSELRRVVKGMDLDTLGRQTEKVKTLVEDWLGVHNAEGYSNEWYREWAGRIMDDENVQQDLVDHLQGQRLSLYPEYENPNLRYSDIAPVWENKMRQTWGQLPETDEHLNVLDQVIRTNDSAEAGKILRQKGIELGIEQVTQQSVSDLGQAFGGQVVNA